MPELALTVPALIVPVDLGRPALSDPEPHTLLVPTWQFWRRWKLARKALLESDLLEIPAHGMGFCCPECRVISTASEWKSSDSFVRQLAAADKTAYEGGEFRYQPFKDEECGALGVLRRTFFDSAWSTDFWVIVDMEVTSASFQVWADGRFGPRASARLTITAPEIAATG
jgi:hypothetical protein